MDFHWSLSDSKSPHVSRTLLSILAVLNNAVIWIVSTHLPNSKSSRPMNNPLVTVPRAPITIGTIVIFMLHSFFQFFSKVKVLILLFTFLQIYSVVRRESKVDNFGNSLFLSIIISSGLLAGLLLSIFLNLCEFFTPTLACGFHRGLSDSKSSQVFRTLLSIFNILIILWSGSSQFFLWF